jgi:hypothetical protein
MKAASIKELKTAMEVIPPQRMVEICLRLVKYKKENKELLTYLLFDADNEANYIAEVKEQIDEEFGNLNLSQFYLAKKTIRKCLRTSNKYIKYSGLKQTEVEILIHFCHELKASGINLKANKVITNLYQRQMDRINKALGTLHEDLQFDYRNEMEDLGL